MHVIPCRREQEDQAPLDPTEFDVLSKLLHNLQDASAATAPAQATPGSPRGRGGGGSGLQMQHTKATEAQPAVPQVVSMQSTQRTQSFVTQHKVRGLAVTFDLRWAMHGCCLGNSEPRVLQTSHLRCLRLHILHSTTFSSCMHSVLCETAFLPSSTQDRNTTGTIFGGQLLAYGEPCGSSCHACPNACCQMLQTAPTRINTTTSTAVKAGVRRHPSAPLWPAMRRLPHGLGGGHGACWGPALSPAVHAPRALPVAGSHRLHAASVGARGLRGWTRGECSLGCVSCFKFMALVCMEGLLLSRFRCTALAADKLQALRPSLIK